MQKVKSNPTKSVFTNVQKLSQHSYGPTRPLAVLGDYRLGKFSLGFRFYVQLFNVHFVSLKRYVTLVNFVILKTYKIKLCFVCINMYKNLENPNWHCIDQMKINFQTGLHDTLGTLVTRNLWNLRTLYMMGNFFQQVPGKKVSALENVCFLWINRYVKCWELSVNNAFS